MSLNPNWKYFTDTAPNDLDVNWTNYLKFDKTFTKELRQGDTDTWTLDLEEDLTSYDNVTLNIFIKDTSIGTYSSSGGTLTISNQSIILTISRDVSKNFPVGIIVGGVLLTGTSTSEELQIKIGECFKGLTKNL